MTEAFTNQHPAKNPAPKRRRWTYMVLSAFGILIAIGFVFARMVKDAREAAHESICRGHIKQLAVALLEYHETYKSFPPAYAADANGQPMHSWRVLLLPWFGDTEKNAFAQYDFSKPWNDPANLKLGGQINLDLFRCPTEPDYGRSQMTNYVVVVGDQTAFPGHRTTKLADIEDGAENTILLVEIGNSDIHWMEPRDLDFDTLSFIVNDPHRPGISSPHPCGPGVSFADGAGIRLAESLRPKTLQALITISSQESVFKKSLILPTDGSGNHLGEDSVMHRQ